MHFYVQLVVINYMYSVVKHQVFDTVENKTFSELQKALFQTVKPADPKYQVKLVEMTGIEPATP